MESHLLQMRGLKRLTPIVIIWGVEVASFTDAWIETASCIDLSLSESSHLLQMRGLKHGNMGRKRTCMRRIFYRCVD